VAIGSLVANYGAMAVLHGALDIPAVPSQALAVVIATPVGFVGNKLWSFSGS
jgi:putative flippase GtrA